MFLNNLLDDTKLTLLYETYDESYINNLDENSFMDIYNVFRTFKFYFMDDIILNYLEIFMMDKDFVNSKLLELNEELGEDFVYIIGNDMRYLEKLFF